MTNIVPNFRHNLFPLGTGSKNLSDFSGADIPLLYLFLYLLIIVGCIGLNIRNMRVFGIDMYMSRVPTHENMTTSKVKTSSLIPGLTSMIKFQHILGDQGRRYRLLLANV